MELVFATGNAHKRKEVDGMLGLDWVRLLNLKDLGWEKDIPETGSTLAANALIKARTIYEAYGRPVFSEDTGLEVMALGMAPGVHTARYAGEERSADNNMSKLLEALAGAGDRTARFRTVVALIWEGGEQLFEGVVNGQIAMARSGGEGFGYDPIFIPYGYERTFADLSLEEKNGISHRYRAMMGMKGYLNKKKRSFL